MNRPGVNRALITLAMLRMGEQDIKNLFLAITNTSSQEFLELLRDLEDEASSSAVLIMENIGERPALNFQFQDFFKEIDQIRRTRLRLPVNEFVDRLMLTLRSFSDVQDDDLPRFDARRGLQAWLAKVTRVVPESVVFNSVIKLADQNSRKKKESAWKLR